MFVLIAKTRRLLRGFHFAAAAVVLAYASGTIVVSPRTNALVTGMDILAFIALTEFAIVSWQLFFRCRWPRGDRSRKADRGRGR